MVVACAHAYLLYTAGNEKQHIMLITPDAAQKAHQNVQDGTCRLYVHTGHVTVGGSICIEALTLSNTAGSWSAAYSVEGTLQTVIANMIGDTLAPDVLKLIWLSQYAWHASETQALARHSHVYA